MILELFRLCVLAGLHCPGPQSGDRIRSPPRTPTAREHGLETECLATFFLFHEGATRSSQGRAAVHSGPSSVSFLGRFPTTKEILFLCDEGRARRYQVREIRKSTAVVAAED